uniref:Col_cuticle_N domain-containing protein n=1 Tax=Meloidogyne hapla TaxID=6305 RepID=A0A1I8BU54_MELHA
MQFCYSDWLFFASLTTIILSQVQSMNTFRQHHQRNKKLQARHIASQKLINKNLFEILHRPFNIDTEENKIYLNAEDFNKNKILNNYEINENNEETKTDETEANMRYNTGHWSWLEMYSVREEVYMFAFTYFGLITVLMVLLLIIISCCYMYDCMGCYDSSRQKRKFGEDYSTSINETKTMELNWTGSKEYLVKTKKSRRWSIL